MRIGITGSSGFIGSELVKYFSGKGHQVLMLQRKPPRVLFPNCEYMPYDISEAALPQLINLDVLIHTAYMPNTKQNNSSEHNIKSTLALAEVCKKINTQFIFLSSMSAHAAAESEYGWHKFQLEQQLDTSHCLILKLGLVIGEQGLFNRIRNTVKKSAVIPLIGGGSQPMQTIYIGDAVKAIELGVEKRKTGIYHLATENVYSMKELFIQIAQSIHQRPLFIPIPFLLAEVGIDLIEILRLPIPVSKENLYGLRQLRTFNTSLDLERFGIRLNSLEDSIRLLKENHIS